MRPVNLLPPEARRGDGAGKGGGMLAYGIVGLLAAILLAVVVLVTTGNKIADKEAELSGLEADQAAATARANSLKPYADFAVMAAGRTVTVSSLAQSRFDWERVLRELALVLPDDIWLVSAAGTVSPNVEIEGGTGNTLRAQSAGPALELVGCGRGHESVAAFVSALKDIDGVTRVGLSSSERPEDTPDSGGAGGSGGGDECRTKDFISKFEIVIVFDAVPVPGEDTTTTGTTAAPALTGTTDTGAAAVPGAQETQAQEQQARDSIQHQTDRANNARSAVGLGGGDDQ
jgi:Tfp pilus assembly protein PilN